MTIRKGEPWGEPGPLPPDGVVVRSDAEARAVVDRGPAGRASRPAARAARRRPVPTLGGTGDEARLRSEAAMQLPVDLGAVLVDGRLHWFVAHLVARRGLVARAGRGGDERPVPRAVGRRARAGIPNDGRLDVARRATCPSTSGSQARRACGTAPTCPHPRHRRAPRDRPAGRPRPPDPRLARRRARSARPRACRSASSPTPSSASSEASVPAGRLRTVDLVSLKDRLKARGRRHGPTCSSTPRTRSTRTRS